MTATDELRRLLDERGVEYYDGTECTLWGYEDYNEFTGIYRFSADETSDGHMQVRLWHVTPEQAIAATLGESMTDTEKAALERRIDELCAEVEYNHQTSRSRLERIDQLKVENTKLRELVRMMWKPFCWAQSGYDVCLTDEQDKAIRDFVRELGIEVD